MKKTISKVLAAVFACLMGVTAVACSDPVSSVPGQKEDPNKTQIYFSVYNGGYGYQWALDAAVAWNQTNDTYEVIVRPNQDEWYTISAALESNTSEYDIFDTSPNIEEGYQKGWFEDLTDVYNATPQGDTQSIYAKVTDKNYVNESLTASDGKKYGLPLSDGFSGFMYDHDLFLDLGCLIGADGQCISSPDEPLSLGKDGLPGTLDDGHPVNMEEYNLMLSKILTQFGSAYLWTGRLSYYTEPLFYSLFAEYAGYDVFHDIFAELEGDYLNPKTNETTPISLETGYEAYKMAGVLESLQFIENYVCNPSYYHADSAKYSTSHTDAQRSFLYGSALGQDTNAAFLFEGIWWENEARGNFNSLVSRGYTDYEYGTHDFRMMTLPALDSYAAYDETVLTAFSTDVICVKKQTDRAKFEAIKDFLIYFYSNESLARATATAGILCPMDIDLEQPQFEQMTKFTQNMYSLYTAQNSRILRLSYYNWANGVNRRNVFFVDDTQYPYPVSIMLRGAGITQIATAQTLYEDTYAHYKANWTSLMNLD